MIAQRAIARGEELPIHVDAGGNSGSRCWIHSRNTADALLYLMRNTTPHLHDPGAVDRPDAYNLVGLRRSNLELAQDIADVMRMPLRAVKVNYHSTRPGHDTHYALDGTKMAELGWVPPMSYGKSLRQTVQWQIAHPEWIDAR